MLKKENNCLKEQMLRFYYQKLNHLNTAYEFKTVETSFGDTNVIVVNKTKKQQLVLVHGFYSNAPFALETLKGLEKYFKIYAIDILGEPNLSASYQLKYLKEEHSKWFYEVLSFLQVKNAHFVGFSLGSYIGLKALLNHSATFKTAFLIDPVGIVKNKLEFSTLKHQLKKIKKEELLLIPSTIYIMLKPKNNVYSTEKFRKTVTNILPKVQELLVLEYNNREELTDFIIKNTISKK